MPAVRPSGLAAIATALALTGLLFGCGPANSTIVPVPVATPAPSPTPAATAALTPTPTGAPPSATCRDGWSVPAAGSPRYEEAVTMIADQLGVTGGLSVDEIRWFTGPDMVGVIEPRYDPIERWYVQAIAATDPTWRGRFLLQKRREDIKGIVAAAPYGTSGYRSPDWRGFIGEGPFRAVDGLPGTWSGVEFDYVTGGGIDNPGMPDDVVGCLEGI